MFIVSRSLPCQVTVIRLFIDRKLVRQKSFSSFCVAEVMKFRKKYIQEKVGGVDCGFEPGSKQRTFDLQWNVLWITRVFQSQLWYGEITKGICAT